MKLHLTNAEVGMWNAEGWSRCAQSFYKIVRIPSFDPPWRNIHDSIFDVKGSMFDVHQFLFRSDWTLAASGAARVKLRQIGTVF